MVNVDVWQEREFETITLRLASGDGLYALVMLSYGEAEELRQKLSLALTDYEAELRGLELERPRRR